MINITEILLCKYRDGQSIKQICRKLGHSKNTIRHYLKDYDCFVEKHPNSHLCNNNYRALIEEYVLNVSFNTPEPKYRVLTSNIIKEINEHLQENISKRKLGLRKQIKRKEDIHKALTDNGYTISYSSVCKYITNNYGRNYQECFIKQHHELGHMAEFDWGEVNIYINGVLRKLKMAAFALPGSTTRWGKLYQRENTISLQEAHADYFRYLGGVPLEVVYDNMKTAVLFQGKEKKPTQGLLNLMNHYGFTHRFCNIRKGNEKGSIELSVKYLRNKAFSGSLKELHFNSMEQANEHLRKSYASCNTQESNIDLFIKEKEALLPLRDDYQCSTLSSSIVDSLSTICYDKTHYSVPDQHVGQTVELRIFSDLIRIYFNRKEICRHDRSYKPTWLIKLDHYLETLTIKTGALKNSVALNQAPERIKELYNNWFMDNSKDFIELLIYLQNNNLSYTHLYNVLDSLKVSNIEKINADIIRCQIESMYLESDNKAIETPISAEAKEVEEYTNRDINSLSRLSSNIACYG